MIRRGGTILPAAAWDKGKKGTFMLKPASLFTDGAVLCRNKEIRIFGEADSGADVTAALLDRRGEVLAEAACRSRDGRFLVLLCPQKAQAGCRLVIRTEFFPVFSDNEGKQQHNDQDAYRGQEYFVKELIHALDFVYTFLFLLGVFQMLTP